MSVSLDGMVVRRFLRFEYDVWDAFKRQGVRGGSVLVAVSGGLDSLALLEVLFALRGVIDVRLGVAYIHHGLRSGPRDSPSARYRSRAYEFVRRQAQIRGIKFFSNWEGEPFAPASGGEAELRKYRYSELSKIKVAGGYQYIALGHHRDDLLETRLIRMIRGTGPEGLESMRWLSGDRMRPLLVHDRQVLRKYLTDRGIQWMEDPTNQSVEPLRNWVRNVWLPQLEAKRPGAKVSLSRSFELLVDSWSREQESEGSESILLRTKFLELTSEKKRQKLASYLRRVGARNYNLAQIDEVIKRLDTPRKKLTFKVAQCCWTINAEQIQACPVS